MQRLIVVSLWTVLLLMAGHPSAAAAKAGFALDEAVVTLPPDRTDGTDLLMLTGTDLPAGDFPLPHITDVGSRDAQVSFTPKAIGQAENTRIWQVFANVAKMPVNVQQSRDMLVEYGGSTFLLNYTLKNLDPNSFEWSVTLPAAKRIWRVGEKVPFFVRVGKVAATNVRLAQTGLVAAPSGRAVDAPILLCRSDISPCTGKPLSLEAGRLHQLYLLPEGSPPPGIYSAALDLVADEKVAGEAIPLELNVTSGCRQAFGVAVIVIGILLALWLGPFGRARVNRTQLDRPAALLREHIRDLQARMARLAPGSLHLSKMNGALVSALGAISPENLRKEGVLPSRLPLFYGPPLAEATTTTYQHLLNEASAKLAAVTYLLDAGVLPALRVPHRPDQQAFVETSVGHMDAFAARPELALDDALRKQVSDELGQLAAGLADPGDARSLPRFLGFGSESDVSTSRIDFEIQTLNLLGWASFAIVSALVGCLALIFSKPDFGTVYDFISCALWGFGIPVAGQQLATVTSPSIATSLGVSLTR